jgi:hypothetical protein
MMRVSTNVYGLSEQCPKRSTFPDFAIWKLESGILASGSSGLEFGVWNFEFV